MEMLTEGYGLIEGPLWLADRGLLFSDVLNGGVFCLAADGAVTEVFAHRRGIGGMAYHAQGGLLVSGRNISYKGFDGGATRTLIEQDESVGLVGFNDITTDSAGRLYAGSLGASPVFDDGRPAASGDLYMIDLDGSVSKVGEDVRLTNGLGFSPDGRTLYHSDSARRAVCCYAVHDDGSLGQKDTFVVTENGAPDGLVVSADGAVWVALAGGGHGVAVFEPNGQQREHIRIPHPMCTSVCFGGDDLTELYIVSGSEGLEGDQRGAVFRTTTSVPGLPVAAAQIALPA